MGLGDELMALGQARALARATGKKVQIVDRHGRRRWHPLWNGAKYLMRIDRNKSDFVTLINGSGCRPYVNYARTTQDRWAYSNWGPPEPGELFNITSDPRARGCVLVEPMIKLKASPNKQWGRWQELVDAAPDITWAQISPDLYGNHWLKGVKRIHTRNFVEACRAILGCLTAVFPEGGLHHAAAALSMPVVVLFGAHCRPHNTGYSFHKNVAIEDEEACGWRVPNKKCLEHWNRIEPEFVLQLVRQVLKERNVLAESICQRRSGT